MRARPKLTLAQLIAEEGKRAAQSPRRPARKPAASVPPAGKRRSVSAAQPLSSEHAARSTPEPPPAQTRPLGRAPIDEAQVREFCHRYLFGDDTSRFNATEAYQAIRPGCTRQSARREASKLLTNPYTQKVLSKLIQRAWERNELDEDYIISGWMRMSQANVYDYFDEDDEGFYRVKRKSQIPAELQRNVKKLKVTTKRIGTAAAPIVSQRVELEIVDAKSAYDSMARAAGMYGDREEDVGNLAKLIEEASERMRKLPARTFDGATGEDITDSEE